jgi:hypothetical protein
VRTAGQNVVDYLGHGFKCWNRRAIDEMMDMYAPDAEVDLSQLLRDENVLRGHAQISAYEVVDGLVARAVFETGRSPQLQG